MNDAYEIEGVPPQERVLGEQREEYVEGKDLGTRTFKGELYHLVRITGASSPVLRMHQTGKRKGEPRLLVLSENEFGDLFSSHSPNGMVRSLYFELLGYIRAKNSRMADLVERTRGAYQTNAENDEEDEDLDKFAQEEEKEEKHRKNKPQNEK